jgi:hypothetical protein
MHVQVNEADVLKDARHKTLLIERHA